MTVCDEKKKRHTVFIKIKQKVDAEVLIFLEKTHAR